MKLTSACLFTILMFVCSGSIAQQTEAFADHYTNNLLYVKMQDDSGYDVKDKQLVQSDGSIVSLPATLNGMGWWSKLHTSSKERLNLYRGNAAIKFGRKFYDPSSEFYFHLYNADQLQDAHNLLSSVTGVQKTLYTPRPVSAPVPDYQTMQRYSGSLSCGINAEAVWTTYNNRGAGIKICDIEYSYNGSHADLNPITLIGHPPTDPFSDLNHGTAVLGVVGSVNNGWGTTGIASDCSLYFAAVDADTIYDVAIAIVNALDTLGAGDVILIEQQIVGPNININTPTTQFGYVAVEWYEPYYNAIQLAIGQGITVVEAAGNGQQDFDAPEYAMNNQGHYPFLPQNNSGAIMVGAGSVGAINSGTDYPRCRLGFSNYGSRLDVQGNGESVVTTGYGLFYSAEGVNKYYTQTFGGTSSASPIVAGAAILLQSVYKNATGITLTPAQVRSYLKATGKPQQDGAYSVAQYPIGPLPDVYEAITQALAATDVPVILSQTAISIYPNPATNTVTIHINNNEYKQPVVTIFNAIGMEVNKYALPASSTSNYTADLSDMSAGMYLVRITSGDKSYVEKLMVTR